MTQELPPRETWRGVDIDRRRVGIGDLRLSGGGVLGDACMAAELYGPRGRAPEGAVLLIHGYTSSHRACGDPESGPDAGWANALIGPGRLLDTERHLVVSANILGSCFGSTGPASPDPGTGAAYGEAFPALSVADMVEAQIRLLRALGIPALHAVVGYSYGGYLAFEWAARHAATAARALILASSPRGRGSEQTVRSLRSLFRNAEDVLEAKVSWRRELMGQYRPPSPPHGPQGLRDQDPGQDPGQDPERIRRWARDFDHHSLAVLREAAAAFDVTGDLSRIAIPASLFLWAGDRVFPCGEIEAVLERAGGRNPRLACHRVEGGHHLAPLEGGGGWLEKAALFLRG